MTKYLFLFLIVFACTNNKKSTAQDPVLSVLVFNDSLIIYNGKLEKETSFKKIKTDKIAVKNIFSENKNKFGEQLTMLIKVEENTFLEHAMNLKQWSEEIGITNVRVAEPDENDIAFFKFRGFNWSYLDSMPRTMDLNMPKGDPYETKVPANALLTLILFKDSIVYYHKSLKDARKAAYKGNHSIRKVIEQVKKDVPEKDLVIFIKPTDDASYANTVDILDEMTINNIKRFALVKLSKEEENALGVKPFALDAPEPVAVEAPSSVTSQVTDEKGFLVELKKDGSAWYSITTDKLEQNPQKVNAPIRKNIGNLMAKYKAQCIKQGLRYRFLVKGHHDTKFPLFEEVIGALKDNDEFKYNLITTDD